MARSASVNPPRFFYGWTVVGASLVALLASGGGYYGFGVFFKPLQNEFGWNHSVTSLVQTVFYVAYGVSLYFSGKLSDRYGPRPLFAVGSLLLALGFGLSSRIHNVAQLLPLYVVAGLGTGTIWATAMGAVQRWFVAKRGLAVAIAASGVGLGMMIFAPFLNYLISAHGWRTTYAVFGVVSAVLLASSIWFMAGTPEEKGLRAYGAPQKGNLESLSIDGKREAGARVTWKTIADRNFVFLTFSYFFGVFPSSLIAVHFVPRAVESGVAAAFAAGVFGFIGGTSVPGRIFGGMLADRLGWKQANIWCYVLGCLTVSWLIFSSSSWMLVFFAISFGFSHGMRVPLLPGLVAQLFGIRSVGELTGLITGLGTGLGGAGAFLAGLVVDVTGSYAVAFAVAALSFVIAGVLVGMVRVPKRTGIND